MDTRARFLKKILFRQLQRLERKDGEWRLITGPNLTSSDITLLTPIPYWLIQRSPVPLRDHQAKNLENIQHKDETAK